MVPLIPPSNAKAFLAPPEYPLLTSLNTNCDISELKEYPLLTSLYIRDCSNFEGIESKNREEIDKYIQKYKKD